MYILGPCSAESREQVLLTARQLKEACGDTPFIYRAGAWKPRTSPDSFQGAGTDALEWLAEVKATLGIPVATEVATPEHVSAALKAGMDYLWIGARSSATPIVVQSLADSILDFKLKFENLKLKGILIKNPVNADAALWLGNIERLEKTGFPVIAVHRGCNHQPYWAMAHQVRLARPDIPMLLDPSHMSGNAEKIPALLDKVSELGLNGAMIEVHCYPEKALSDNAQQITPSQLLDYPFSILSRMCLASLISTNDSQEELNWLRAEIDELDDRLWTTLAERMNVSERIGEWKKAHGIAPLQPERYQQILDRRKAWATANGMDAAFIEQLFTAIHAESLKRQE